MQLINAGKAKIILWRIFTSNYNPLQNYKSLYYLYVIANPV